MKSFFQTLLILSGLILLEVTIAFSPNAYLQRGGAPRVWSESSSSLSSEESSTGNIESPEDDEKVVVEEVAAIPVANPTPTIKRIDPLVASVTRTDNGPPVDPNTPTINLPIAGNVLMDQTFFVLVPVVLFAVLGGLLSLYVALNSGDAFSQAWNAYETAISSPAGTKIVDPNVCRGLCSSQADDLQGLETFMKGLAGKN